MSTPPENQSHRILDERGASLVIALVFISVFSLLLIGLNQFTDASSEGQAGFRNQRTANYATDAALDAAVNRLHQDKDIGKDPSYFPSDKCNATNNDTVLKRTGTGNDPTISVSCVVNSGTGSGLPADLGSAPPYALLSLGDRRTDVNAGTPTSLGVRDNEPGPYNGNAGTSSWFGNLGDQCGGERSESGMRLNRTVYPWVFWLIQPIIPLDNGCATNPNAFAWNVQGNVFSNSKITIDNDSSAAVPTQIPIDGTQGTIEARGSCFGSAFGGPGSQTYCTDPGWNFNDGKGKDPGLVPATAAQYTPRSLSGLTVQSVPPASQCTNARHLVTFSPGIYTDATAMNTLFADANCKNATFWFTPGAYYFDFRNSTTSYQCGTDQSNGLYDVSVTQATAHQWCIGGAGNDYGGQRVVGGTPYNWSPTVDVGTHVITLGPAGRAGAGPGAFFGLFPQPTAFTNGDNCAGATSTTTLTDCAKAIENPTPPVKTVNYVMSGSRAGSSIWLSDYPDVARGAYGTTVGCPGGVSPCGIDLEIAQGAINPDRMNAPTIQVDYQTSGIFGLTTTGTCGPYTLDKPPAGGAVQTKKLSQMTDGINKSSQLTACLNTGDKINSAVVRYNVNRPGFQGSPYATAKLDGVRFLITANDSPTFPRPPSETDAGGDCDPKGPGVQFMFGGDSRVYVPNGGLELCAGPNPTDPGAGQQIALYDTPATPRLVPASASGGTNPDNAKAIAENPTVLTANMTSGQAVTLSYAGLATPAGYSVSKVEMRASFDASSAATAAILNSSSGAFSPSTGCSNTFQNGSGVTGVVQKTIDVTGCLNTGGRLGGAFNVKWTGGSGSPKLDGVEFIVTLAPTNPDTTMRPANGCIVNSPNLWYGSGNPDCSVIRVDGPIDTSNQLINIPFGSVEKRGRLSIHGSVYAPSAAVDIDDEDVWYPIASRGMIARHLRLRGFKYHSGYNEPAFGNYLNTKPAERQVVFLACKKASGPCTATDPTLVGRAAVTFSAVTSQPQIQAWSVGKI